MKTIHILFLVVLVSAASLLSASLARRNMPITVTTAAEPTFDRVMKNKELRCGYIAYAPSIIRDPNTGALSGIVHDVVETAAARLKLKVVWAEETAWGQHLEGLNTGRHDMLCTASFALPSDAARAETIGPLYYSAIGVWVRTDDRRFTDNLASINHPQTVISAIDGTIPAIIAQEQFPKAKLSSHPQLTDYSTNMLDVAQGKADVTFVENYYGLDYLAHNPGTLKNIAAKKPLRVFHDMLLVNKGEFKLQSMFQNVIAEMLNSGELDAIIDRYERYPGALYRVTRPYMVKKEG
ncbi:MAG: transporter substrate-binding domain-containing protein [Alphaproteobacteria bacterium]|nr:transporter substrate-binding domain-containing protein [Alphaproteobacteria bacterium]